MKYYRVIKDTFLWNKGAILELDANKGINGCYMPIEDIWNVNDSVSNEYISAQIVESNPEWFERVYSGPLNKLVFKTAQEMKELYNKFVS